MENLFKYNRPETALVITSFPNPGDETFGKRSFNAVGWHSEKTLRQLSKESKVLVCAEKNGDNKYLEAEENLLVVRNWGKGNNFSLISLLFFILKFQNIKSIFVQFEFNVFGGILPNLILLIILFILRLKGRQITFELHQVITDISLLQKHINITNKIIQSYFNFGLKLYYVLLGLIAHKIIVFEQELKNRLLNLINPDIIEVLSLSVIKKSLPSKIKSRRKLGLSNKEFVILVFGFINGYKGIDWIIKQIEDNTSKVKNKKIRLLIAGGKNPYLKKQEHYQKFYNSIINGAKKYKNITLTGFVPGKEVSTCFAASDLIVLPYEVFMSASGPFSLALSFEKPIILSKALETYTNSVDFKKAMKENNLSKKDLFFRLNQSDLFDLVRKAQKSKRYYKKLINFSQLLGQLRSSEEVVGKLQKIIFEPAFEKPITIPNLKLVLQS